MKVEGFKEGNSNAVKPLHYYKKKLYVNVFEYSMEQVSLNLKTIIFSLNEISEISYSSLTQLP